MLGDMHIGARASDLLDGRLSAAEQQRVEAHLAHCVRCTELVHAEQQVRALLRGTGQAPAPASRELVTGLLALPGESPSPSVRQPGRRARVGLLAVGAAVTLGVAAPVAAGAGAAVTTVLPDLWGRGPGPTAKMVVVPAGPRTGASVRFESSRTTPTGPASSTGPVPTSPVQPGPVPSTSPADPRGGTP